ncbi:MAG: DUF4065 domain-containing protein [Oscillospiraceae bacterium]|nr:DUF4065 domain-containing protein [Oscillospiraceae bacterium]
MTTVLDVAKYILSKQGEISTWKLQKLCYYSQAWALAWSDGVSLFNEDFQAWTNGPVCRKLYDLHKGEYLISYDDFNFGNIDNLTEDEKDTIDTVLENYGDKSPFWLREQTHDELPWKDARGKTPENMRSENIISKESMGNYYGSL